MKNFLFELKEGLAISFMAIKANKIRSALTAIGIFIGVTSVVLMSTAIKGINNSFQNGISALGADNLYIDKWKWFNDEEWWKTRNRKNIDMDEYEKYRELAKLPAAIAPTVWTNQNVKNGGKSIDGTLLTGTTNEYLATTNFTFNEGRFFNEVESKGNRNVCVIGSDVAKNLFGGSSALEQFIKIKGIKFKVVGVLSEQGSFMLGSFNPDKQVYLPIGNIFKYFQSQNFRSVTITVRVSNTAMIEQTKEEAQGIMRKIRGLNYNQEDDFSINQQEGFTKLYDQTVGVIQIVGLFITGLSLFVGAIGIMNIMFVSVKERTKEIGIRKAIGAKKRTILSQFISEAIIICMIGGLVGLIGAVILSKVINQFLPTSFQFQAVILAIVISLITGVVSGFAPAYSAAKMDPVEALRYE
ncbi:MAG: ABC transporter permease [Bacteroidota bacterium]|nr:ABC transporter permease [Bacteroidota bacterium]MDP4193966.1 ABC transporter permease [Bacteroidota bacterium]